MVQEAAESWGEGKGRIIQAGEAGYAKVLNGGQVAGRYKEGIGCSEQSREGLGLWDQGLGFDP